MNRYLVGAQDSWRRTDGCVRNAYCASEMKLLWMLPGIVLLLLQSTSPKVHPQLPSLHGEQVKHGEQVLQESHKLTVTTCTNFDT